VDYATGLNWKRSYASNILDGIQWRLTFANGHEKLNCFGNNAYPDDFDNLTTLIKKITRKHKIPVGLLE
jgi:hypothetical protein